MAKYVVTYRDQRTGRKVQMPVEAVSATNAKEIGSFFERSHGKMLTAGKDAPRLADQRA